MSWLISNALMNSLSLQGLAVESLVDTSLDGEQFALSSGKPIPQAFLSPDKMTEFSRLSRFGMMFKADVGANHQRDRIWIVARWKGNLPHAQHDRIRWWEQQQKSVKETHGETSDSASIGSQEQANECLLEGEGRGEFQSEQPRYTSNVANTRCELRSERDSGDLDTQEEIGTSSPILNQSSGQGCGEDQVADTREIRPCGKKTEQGMARELRFAECGVDRNWWQREPEFVPRTTQRNMGGVVDGVASRVDRLKAIGNGQVPLCAATAWRILSE